MSEKNDDIKHDAALTQDDASQANSNNFDSSENSFQSKTFNDQNDTGLLPAELSKAGLDAVSSLSGSMAALIQNAEDENPLDVDPGTTLATNSISSLILQDAKPEVELSEKNNSENQPINDFETNLVNSSTSFSAPEPISKSFGTEIEPEIFVNTAQVIGVASKEDDLIPASLIPASLIPAMAEQSVMSEEKASATTTAGILLKQARENANVSELSLAAQLKVSVKTLRALEADEFHLLPGVAFSRSLVTSICRTIKVDATEILALMPKLPQAKSEASQPRGLNLPMSGSSIDVADTFGGVGIRVLAALIVIGIAIAVVVNWSSASSSISSLSSSSTASDAAVAADTSVSTPVVSSLPMEVSSQAASVASAASIASAITVPTVAATASVATPAVKSAEVKPVASVVASAPALPTAKTDNTVVKQPSTTASAAVATTPSTTASLPVAAQAGQAIIVFKLTDTSYLEVSEAGGKQLLGKNGVKDDEVTVLAKMPVKVKVGNATSTTVIVNGQIYNTAPYSKGNVARFELK